LEELNTPKIFPPRKRRMNSVRVSDWQWSKIHFLNWFNPMTIQIVMGFFIAQKLTPTSSPVWHPVFCLDFSRQNVWQNHIKILLYDTRVGRGLVWPCMTTHYVWHHYTNIVCYNNIQKNPSGIPKNPKKFDVILKVQSGVNPLKVWHHFVPLSSTISHLSIVIQPDGILTFFRGIYLYIFLFFHIR
jgi:hypothetical protein